MPLILDQQHAIHNRGQFLKYRRQLLAAQALKNTKQFVTLHANSVIHSWITSQNAL